MKLNISQLSVVILGLAGNTASAVTVFSTNFSSLPSELNIAGTNWGTATVHTTSFGGNTHAFVDVTTFGVSGNWLQVDSNAGNNQVNVATFSLSGLASHTTISLGMFLASGGGIDGGTGSPVGNDSFAVIVDGVTVFNNFFAARPGAGSSYAAPPGVTLLGQATTDTDGSDFLSARTGAWGHDALYDLSLDPALQNIAHTSSTATIQIVSRLATNSGVDVETGSDEQLAIANFTVSTNAIPEPAGAVLSGLAAVMLMGRRRRA
jgi:hypothetical protein